MPDMFFKYIYQRQNPYREPNVCITCETSIILIRRVKIVADLDAPRPSRRQQFVLSYMPDEKRKHYLYLIHKFHVTMKHNILQHSAQWR
jgi:hypothetical protein